MGALNRVVSFTFAPLIDWIATHPVRTAGGVAAALAAWVVLASVGVVSLAGVSTDGATVEQVVRFALNRPAYPAAVLVGLGALLFAR